MTILTGVPLKSVLCLLATALVSGGSACLASEVVSAANESQGVSLTIYNQNFG